MADKSPSQALLDVVAGLDRASGVGPIPSDLPPNVQAYMRNAPSFAEGSTRRDLGPAVTDLFAQEQLARAAQLYPGQQGGLGRPGEGRDDALVRQLFGMRDSPNTPPLSEMANEQNNWQVAMTVPGAAPVPAGPQSLIPSVPSPSVDPVVALMLQQQLAQHPVVQALQQLWNPVPGTQDNPLIQPGPGGAPVGARDVPGSADKNRFWNPDSNIAPYNPPGVPDDRINDASLLRLFLQGLA
jgi:hypothetical protein